MWIVASFHGNSFEFFSILINHPLLIKYNGSVLEAGLSGKESNSSDALNKQLITKPLNTMVPKIIITGALIKQIGNSVSTCSLQFNIVAHEPITGKLSSMFVTQIWTPFHQQHVTLQQKQWLNRSTGIIIRHVLTQTMLECTVSKMSKAEQSLTKMSKTVSFIIGHALTGHNGEHQFFLWRASIFLVCDSVIFVFQALHVWW